MDDQNRLILRELFSGAHAAGHLAALGIAITDFGDGWAESTLRCRSDFVDGVANGAILTLLDTCCGAAVFAKVGGSLSVVTLELRADLFRRSLSGTLNARAECNEASNGVAYVQADVLEAGTRLRIATACARFSISGKKPP